TTKALPVAEAITPKWLPTFLPWVSVEAGTYRINKTRSFTENYDDPNESCEKVAKLYSGYLSEYDLPQTYHDYENNPKEYVLSTIQTILRANTHVMDIFNSPIDQLAEQFRITTEAMREMQEWQVINNTEFGLVNCVANSMKIQPRSGRPTPNDLDELISKVWKKPAIFLAHPRAIAAIGRECTRRGVPPVTINILGSPFVTWRGVPIVPCDKLMVSPNETTNILLMRVGEKEQGVIGLHQPGIPDESTIPSLSIKFAGIDHRGVSAYLMNLYFSVAVLAEDALGMLENIDIGRYDD
ncbi:MAG: hypothetical protein H7X94_14750, partial [Vallitaleaceae bacterium]|nr:hypothetical protein [Vallitaleaceae bacterium]